MAEFTTFQLTLLILMVLMCLMLFFVYLRLRMYVEQLRHPTADEAYIKAMQHRTFWQKFWSLKPLSMEKFLQLDHQFDGIAELDNPTPPWFMYLFYGTIAFSIFYLVGYHIIGSGNIMQTEYKEEVAIAEKEHELYMRKFANMVNENNVKFLTDTKVIQEGAKIYTQNCIACHGDKGQGLVGPNLCDEYWLHGGSAKAIFHTIAEGVPEKGMISWKKTLNPLQIQQVLSYVHTFKGTNPAQAKAPQGDKYIDR